MSPSFTVVHGGQHMIPNMYVTFEWLLLLHAAFVADEIWGGMLEPQLVYRVREHHKHANQENEGDEKKLASPICRRGLQKQKKTSSCRTLVLLVEAGFSAAQTFGGESHQKTRRSRATALPTSSPRKDGIRVRVRVWVRSGVGLVWVDGKS